jgi:squalene-associated FAD-dependent desaturase
MDSPAAAQGGPAMTATPSAKRIAIVGGGLAGLAAAVALGRRGFAIDLFESRPRLGGRAGSFRDPVSGESIDFCQHVAMGCCTAWADFCRETGIADGFERRRRLHFLDEDGQRHDFAGSRWLPAPLHLLPGLLGLGYLRLHDRISIARAMLQLAQTPLPASQTGDGADLNDASHLDDAPAGRWLRDHGQSPQAIERFWSVVLASALSDEVDRVSLAAVRKVFCDGFMARRNAYELEIPRTPLGEVYDRRLGAWLTGHGVNVRLATRVAKLEGDAARIDAAVLANGTRRAFDGFIVAVPWNKVRTVVSDAGVAIPGLANVAQFRAAPITAVHLWFDRPITPLPHAVLVGRMSPWFFSHGPVQPADGAPPAWRYQVVVSASFALQGRPRDETLAAVREHVSAVFPDARTARLVRWRVVNQPKAVFSMAPGVERLRPSQATPIANLALAGDWTKTGWPATMEGAVRSGNLAAEILIRALG